MEVTLTDKASIAWTDLHIIMPYRGVSACITQSTCAFIKVACLNAADEPLIHLRVRALH